jgi:hypothetical protein
MFHVSDHRTGDLFDLLGPMGKARRALLEEGWPALFRAHVLPHLPVGSLAPFFHPSKGRPTTDPYIMLGILILQHVHDLTDQATVEAVALNAAWQYALDIRQESQAMLTDRTLRNYRALLIEHDLDQTLFRNLTDHLIRVFKVDAAHQRIDSTVLHSAMRKLGRLGTFTETIEMFLRQLAKSSPQAHQQLDPALLERYADGGKGLCFGFRSKPSEAAVQLEQTAQDLLQLLERFAGTPAAELEGYKLLQRLLDEHCQLQGEGLGRKLIVKDQRQVSGDSLQNPSDPDATYNGHNGDGYLMQVMETYSPQAAEQDEPAQPDLITHVSINAMTDHDGQAMIPAVRDAAARQAAPKELLGDTHYGVGDNPQKAAEEGVTLISPAQPPKAYLEGKLSLENFELDAQGLVVECPTGQKPISTSSTEKNYQARFARCVCENCPLRPNCPVQNPRPTDPEAMRLQYDRPRLEMFHRRRSEQEEWFKDRYRWRAGIEATMSRLKHQVGLGMLRVRGLAAVTFKAFMGALALNILRCAAVA